MKKEKPHILVSPLDWGLGHASRCVPLIDYLLESGCKVSLAASGLSLELLQSNFKQQVQYFEIPAYQITYPEKKKYFHLKIISQLPKIQKAIQEEKKWLDKLIEKEGIDAVISDNRYGLYHQTVPTVIMTHQWQVLSGISKTADSILLKWHEARLKKFGQVWIVDEANQKDSLAGKLAHPQSQGLKGKVHYIGHLSQLKRSEQAKEPIEKNRILALLSGPEPARTQLFETLWQQAKSLDQYDFTFISGQKKVLPIEKFKHIDFIALANASTIQKAMAQADLVICRSGYSSLMDLKLMGAKALLIPTPGQTEQVYLAENLSLQKRFMAVDQAVIDLLKDIPKARLFPGFSKEKNTCNQTFKELVATWLTMMKES